VDTRAGRVELEAVIRALNAVALVFSLRQWREPVRAAVEQGMRDSAVSRKNMSGSLSRVRRKRSSLPTSWSQAATYQQFLRKAIQLLHASIGRNARIWRLRGVENAQLPIQRVEIFDWQKRFFHDLIQAADHVDL
jgi:hypothetical protein